MNSDSKGLVCPPERYILVSDGSTRNKMDSILLYSTLSKFMPECCK